MSFIPTFLCFEVLFLSVVYLVKKHLQLFLVQGWNVAISSLWANQIPFQSLLLFNEVQQTVSGTACLVLSFYSCFREGVSCSMEEWRRLAILEGGVYMWDRVGCQFLSGTEVCVAVSLWQGDWGVGARQGLTWSKTQMQSHIGKVREGERSHAGLPSYPVSLPSSPPFFSHNNSHGRDEP